MTKPSLAAPVLARLMGNRATFGELVSGDRTIGQYRWGHLAPGSSSWDDLRVLTDAGYQVSRSPGGRFLVSRPR